MKNKSPMDQILFFKSERILGKTILISRLFVETYHEDRKRVGLCYPQTYEEHYMRVFVKDELKVTKNNNKSILIV